MKVDFNVNLLCGTGRRPPGAEVFQRQIAELAAAVRRAWPSEVVAADQAPSKTDDSTLTFISPLMPA